jgi:hypothetical protein
VNIASFDERRKNRDLFRTSGADFRRRWRVSLYSGLIAGLVSLIVETPFVWFINDQTPWLAARMTAAMLLGPDAMSPPATFDLWLVALAFAIHIALSVVYALTLGAVVQGMPTANAAYAGGMFGIVLYFINLHVIAPAFFPWFIELRNVISLISHIVFGAIAGGCYVFLTQKPIQHELQLFFRDRRFR